MNKLLGILVYLLLVSTAAMAAERQDDQHRIDWVLAYTQPKHKCVRPKTKKSNEVAGKVARYQRKVARYAKCVKAHQLNLIDDHQQIVAIAKHNITQSQAKKFAEKLKNIEKTITELGNDVDVSLNPVEVDRILRIGNRPSAT